MLATRHYDANHAPWPLENPHEASSRRPLSPRMSDHYASSLSTQPEWHGDYTYSQHSEEVNFAHPFDRNSHGLPQLRDSPSAGNDKEAHNLARVKEEERSPHVQHMGRDTALSTSRDVSAGTGHQPQHHSGSVDSESLRESVHAGRGSSINASGASSESDAQFRNRGGSLPTPDERFSALKEEDEDAIDEDEALDGEGDAPQHSQTAAERTAARRKMKRFRLTHQQTRFLMSEFVKQPHPDAAHRERLSREIPGLSPRQVQVWFQNRRAKIKRLNAEDRDRVIKMRAVPEDFDNIQALHSPYGAMNGIGAPLAAASELGNAPYGEHMGRPLVVDVRRPESEDNISPTGLTPAFDGVGFSHHGGHTTDMMPNISSATSDRSHFANHLQNSVGPRPRPTPNAFPGRLDNGAQFGQPGMRPLQPLHLRDTTPRPRADSLHSPLRANMSWKGETLDYSHYPMGNSASPPLPDRQQPMYPMASPSNGSAPNYGTDGFSNNAFHSSTTLDYSSMQQGSRDRPRLRAASATFPLSLETRGEYRPPMPTQSPVHAYSGRSAGASSQYTSPSIYTTSYPPAPLTAPISMSHQRPSSSRDTAHEHSEAQLSAPLNAPSEFHGATGNPTVTPHSATSPIKEPFISGQMPYGQTHEKQPGYDNEVGGDMLQRKSSFAVQVASPQEGHMPGTQPHTFDHSTT